MFRYILTVLSDKLIYFCTIVFLFLNFQCMFVTLCDNMFSFYSREQNWVIIVLACLS